MNAYTPWGPSSRVAPVVDMAPTTFRTRSVVGLIGTPNAAIRIVAATPYAQRVVVLQTAGATPAFVGFSAADLETPGTVAPGGAFQLPPGPVVLVLAENQPLLVAATAAGTRIAVSASQEIPIGPSPTGVEIQPTTFRTYTTPVLGAQAAQVVPTVRTPKRVVARTLAGVVFLSDSAGELNSGGPIPGGSFEMPAALTASGVIFVLAPNQKLSAVSTGVVGGAGLAMSVSEIPLPAIRGPTGIPGPDGQE